MRTKSSTSTAKVCFIVRRYEVKRTGSICAIIRNEAGTEYTACLHSNGRTSCTCPARGLCYHIRHLHAKEYERNNHTEQEVMMPAQEVEQAQRAEKPENVAVSAQTSVDTTTHKRERSSAIVASMSSVERSAPAWMMRGFASNGWMADCRC